MISVGFFRSLADSIINGLQDISNAGYDVVSDPTGEVETANCNCLNCKYCHIEQIVVNDPYVTLPAFFCSNIYAKPYRVFTKISCPDVVITDLGSSEYDFHECACNCLNRCTDEPKYTPVDGQQDFLQGEWCRYSYVWEEHPFNSFSDSVQKQMLYT